VLAVALKGIERES